MLTKEDFPPGTKVSWSEMEGVVADHQDVVYNVRDAAIERVGRWGDEDDYVFFRPDDEYYERVRGLYYYPYIIVQITSLEIIEDYEELPNRMEEYGDEGW